MKTYGQVVESIEALTDEQQEALVKLVQHRLADRRREALAKSVREARREYKSGKLRPASSAAIMRRILK